MARNNNSGDRSIHVPDKVIVVGRHRLRLSKIICLLKDDADDDPADEDDDVDTTQHNAVDYIPCLAAMNSYQDEDGNPVRYLAHMVYLLENGSTEPMTSLMDDDEFRNSLKAVVMVGYEWLAGDQPHLQKYFAMYYSGDVENEDSNLPPVMCVAPNDEYSTLQEEMEAFKHLDEDAKAQVTNARTMGPGKMAQFVMETYRQLLAKDDEQEETTEETIYDSVNDNTLEAPERADEESLQPQPLHIDPNKPMFACRMCRTVLFGEDHLADNHIQSQHSFLHKHHHHQNGNKNKINQQKCQSLFCDESVLANLHSDNDPSEIEGRLQCPNTKCNHKLGHWNWSGAQCSCGTWVVPAIQIPLSKVDAILPRNGNVDTAAGANTMISPVVAPVLP